ncbi:MAG: ATP-binding protein [Calditrichia bacterium]
MKQILNTKTDIIWSVFLLLQIGFITYLHYSTPTHIWQYHLVFMEMYFVPILTAAFLFGLSGGVISSILVAIAYLPHVMLQWGGLIETNLMRFMQVGLFIIVGILTGYLASKEKEEKKKAQKSAEDLKNALNDLEIQYEKTSALEAQLQQADRLSIIGELTASLAHEIRNPLNSILGVAQILKDEARLSGKHQEFIHIMEEEIQRLSDVLENYLQFSRKNVPKSLFRPIEVVDKIIRMVGPQLRKKGIEIDIDMNDQMQIYANPIEFHQVLMNIILNSIQSLQSGGAIHIFSSLEQGRGVIVISDNGPGIPSGILSDIFKPFVSGKENGSGLGLAIVKRIVDNNGWSISVSSDPHKKTSFILEIPINSE